MLMPENDLRFFCLEGLSMNKNEILEFIDSKDIREYNQDTSFSPTQKAILIARSQKQPIENKIKAMERLLLDHLDWDFPCVAGTDKRISFREVAAKELDEWKEALERRYDNREAVYISRLSEVEYLSNDDGNPRFFSNYAKAYESLVTDKNGYLDNPDLKDVRTLGEIIRITVDAGNASYGYDQRQYLFDTDMRLIDAYRKCYDDTCPESSIDAYHCYIPLPFKAGDIIKCESPYHETYYGVFPYDRKEPENRYGTSSILELSKCKDDKLLEDQR